MAGQEGQTNSAGSAENVNATGGNGEEAVRNQDEK